MAAQLYIPKKIRVGFQNRSDTFTGKLAYVIYYDEKNKLRKETSWNSWRDDKIEPVEFDNVPMNGFIFNKGIQRSREWFGNGRSVFRVYAPYDFEFEINTHNLINLLMHSDVNKREITEQCVFAWSGPELVLLPVNSVEYQESVEYTEKQSTKVSTKDLIKGCKYYKRKSDDILTYLGFFEWWDFVGINGAKSAGHYVGGEHKSKGKKHIFVDQYNHFTPCSASTLSSIVSTDVVDNYAKLVDNFFSTINSQPIVDVVTAPYRLFNFTNEHSLPVCYKLENDRVIAISCSNYHSQKVTHLTMFYSSRIKSMVDGCIKLEGEKYYNSSNWSRSYGQPDTYTKDVTVTERPKVEQLAIQQNINVDQITVSDYVKVMTELGYGELFYVLQNGKKVKYKMYYY